MGPVLVIDKSALQSFSFEELLILHTNFHLNIVPILVIEILGDIKKPAYGSLSREKVSELARKVFPFDSAVNMHYQDLLRASLLGYEVPLGRRPILAGGNQVRTTQGEIGMIFEESPEEKALRRWRNGDFNAAEEILGEKWRESTRNLDLEEAKRNLQVLTPKSPIIKDRSHLNQVITNTLEDDGLQRDLLKIIMVQFHLSTRDAQQSFFRWETSGCPPLRVFAPYALHCLRVNLFFMLGLLQDLISTRSTNRVDMEYLYYLPFCMVFCSEDKFHCQIAPFFLGENQQFVRGADLKDDLKKRILGQSDTHTDTNHDQSLITQLWNQFMARPRENYRNFADTMDKESNKKMAEFIKSKIRNAEPSEDSSVRNSQQADFVIKKFETAWGDVCPCGSGKLFGECHGPKVVQKQQPHGS